MKLVELRQQRGMTQKQLGEALGLSTSSIAMYEIGERIPKLRKAQDIADYFGVSVEDIFFEKDAHTMKARADGTAV